VNPNSAALDPAAPVDGPLQTLSAAGAHRGTLAERVCAATGPAIVMPTANGPTTTAPPTAIRHKPNLRIPTSKSFTGR